MPTFLFSRPAAHRQPGSAAPLFRLTAVLLAAACLLTSCRKKEWYGDLEIAFSFSYNGTKIETLDGTRLFAMPTEDSVPSGQSVTIEEIRYFISKVYLIEENGERVALTATDGNGCHFVDFALAGTRQWTIEDVPTGHYVGIGFTYGLDEADNVSHRFPNPPESLMFWPEALGGGYHYMQINGKWLSAEGAAFMPYGLHTGIGQTWTDGVATAFHQNYVRLEFPDAFSLFLTMDNRRTLTIDMDVMQWLTNPHQWDFAVQGGAIMQNQAAQQILKENAWNVFSIH